MTKIYRLHPVVQEAYLSVHEWLAGQSDATNYLDISLKKMELDNPDMKHIAAQFALLFHAHHFKSSFILNEILTYERLVSWIRQNQRITLVDMGCGAGAASAALIAALIELIELEHITHEVTLVCIGVDLVENVLGIYNKLLEGLKEKVSRYGIRLEVRVVDRPASESVTDLDEHLRILLEKWDQPALAQVVIAQSNIVRPLSSLFEESQERKERLNELGIPSDRFINEDTFGIREVRSYRQLFAQLPVDNLHVLTVGTNKNHWIRRIEDMGDAIAELFSAHDVQSFGTCIHSIDFENPTGSHWVERKGISRANKRKFVTDVRTVQNKGHSGDNDWHRVIASENLELAWARARALLQSEVLYDEVEIRLFERNRDANLKRLHQELVSYDINVARTSDRLQFRFVKNEKEDEGRPRALSRIEEEILSIAIVQELGAAAFGLNTTSYAYRPNPRFASRSEFLYEYWFSAYQRFKEDAYNAVAKHSNCKVLTVDIKSYFTGIPQQQLVEAVQKEIRSQSARIKWLLQRILCKSFDHHDQGHGLSQGGAGSGFYANAYLTGFDSNFGINNEWEAQIFRFVDDIVIVLPDPDSLSTVVNVATSALSELGLNVNDEKSKPFDGEAYLNLPHDEGVMNCLSQRFNAFTKPLWRTNCDMRKQLRQHDGWWQSIAVYGEHLNSIGLFIEPHRLSRKLNQYVENYRLEHEDEDPDWDFKLPPLEIANWADEFIASNELWIEKRRSLRTELIALARESYEKLPTVRCEKETRLLSTRIYFSANRLASLGFGDAVELITSILVNQPWIIRQPQYVIRGLAIQGYSEYIECLFHHYRKQDTYWCGSFLAVIVRSVRHLNEVPDELEAGVISIATESGSEEILKLMATETWLMKFDCQSVRQHELAIRSALGTEQSSRLRKNYLLLLGKCIRDAVVPSMDYDDPLLERAAEVLRDNTIHELFNYVEPDILRERYYARYYPDNIGEYGDDMSY